MKNFAAAARAEVRRIVYLGAIQPTLQQPPPLNSRRYCGELFQEAGVPTVELRAGIIMEARIGGVRGDAGSGVQPAHDGDAQMGAIPYAPIALSNLLHYLVGLVEAEGVDGRIFNAAGPELLSYQQQLQKFAAHIGKRCPIIPLPFLSPRLSAWWLQFATSVPQPWPRRWWAASNDIPADDGSLRALLPQTLLSFDEALTESLAWSRGSALSSRGEETPLGLRWRHPEYGF